MSKILIVDDEWAITELLKLTLSTAGHEVIVASSAEEFLLKARGEKPDIIILDIMLGPADGMETYERLLGHGFDPKVPVIFLSALAHDVSPVHPKPGRTYALLAKPFDLIELTKEISGLAGV